MNGIASTAAVIAIAQNANRLLEPNGSRIVKPSCLTVPTITSCSPSRKRLPRSHPRTKSWSMPSSFVPQRILYARRPVDRPQQARDYVGRNTRRVAISNSRLRDSENDRVCFQSNDYRAGGEVTTMTLSADESIRRSLLHVLPNGFQRIRYYGLLGNRYRQEKLDPFPRLLGMHIRDQQAGLPARHDYRGPNEGPTGHRAGTVAQWHGG